MQSNKINEVNDESINSDNYDKSISLTKFLMVFYILIATNNASNLMAKQLQEYIKDNKIIQHIIGFMALVILITLFAGPIDTKDALFYGIIGYAWFIFTTKLDIHWNIIILILLFIGYMYENNMNIRIIEIKSDKNLTHEKKQSLIKDISHIRNWIVGGIMVVTLTGTLFYSHKKHEQYGGGYDVFTYILG